ncbi:MAG: tetratricopeptide repeat protein [Erythrobacter sp.]|nr:tetratricopeptide repeat protein [Erythrobacter sp.]MDZ4272651.1 tetratricopeptide repeat protein [Erythrobacter sp.]
MKKTPRRLFCALLVLSLGACTPTPEALFAEGEAAFQAHDYRKAWFQISEGLKQQPGNPEMQMLLVRALLKLGQGERAALALQQMSPQVRAEPAAVHLQAEADVLRGRFDEALAGLKGIDNAEADRLSALAFIGKGDPSTAEEHFKAGMTREDVSALLLASYARFEFKRGNWNRADELSTSALKRDAELIDAMLVRGDLLERRNELAASRAVFETALRTHPSNFDARLGHARLLAAMGEGERALEIAKALQEEVPDSLAVAKIPAAVAAQKKDWASVRDILQPFERGMPAQADAALLYSEALIELGLPGQAVNTLGPQFERQPGWRKLRVTLARALSESGEPAKALAIMRPLAERPDATPDELRLATRIAKGAGAPDAARFQQRAGKAAPEWVGGQIAVADRALRNRQWAQAEEAYLDIIARLGPSNAMVLNNLAYAQGELGKPKDALASALAAVELAPTNASILDTAGILLIANGQRDRGITMLRKAASIAPDNAVIRRHLAEAGAT